MLLYLEVYTPLKIAFTLQISRDLHWSCCKEGLDLVQA
jgi:hypothetical protein